jgi:hypothetical protein
MKRTTHRLTAWAVALSASAIVLLALAPAALAGLVKPNAKTGSVTNTRGTSGQLNGAINPKGLPVSYFFKYGPSTSSYLYQTPTVALPLPPATTTIKVGQLVNNLQTGDYYDLVATYPAVTIGTKTYPAGTVEGGAKRYSPTKSTHLSFEIEKGKEAELSVAYGGTFHFTGRLEGAGDANHSVTLQQTPFPYTAAFTTLGSPVLTNSVGTFTFAIPDMTHNVQLRVSTSDVRPIYSPVVDISVTPKVSLRVRAGGKTGLYRLFGTVEPSKPGAVLVIQRLVPRPAKSRGSGPVARTVGSTVLKRATKKLSRFSIVLSLTGTYHYRAYLELPRGSLSAGHSEDVLIRSPRAATQHTQAK